MVGRRRIYVQETKPIKEAIYKTKLKRNQAWKLLKDLSWEKFKKTPDIEYRTASKDDIIKALSKVNEKIKDENPKTAINRFIKNFTGTARVKIGDFERKLKNLSIPKDKILLANFTSNDSDITTAITGVHDINRIIELRKTGIIDQNSFSSDSENMIFLNKNDTKLKLSWIDKPKNYGFKKATFNKKYEDKYVNDSNRADYEAYTKQSNQPNIINKLYNKHKGRFFTYYNKTNIDLSRYQIFRETDQINDEGCFIYALEMSNVLTEEEMNTVKLLITEKYFNVDRIKYIVANLKDVQINLKISKQEGDAEKHHTRKIGKGGRVINIGLLNQHYFINDQTNITKSSIEYYEEVKNHKYFPEVNVRLNEGVRRVRKATKGLDSFDVIKYFLEFKDKVLEPITLANLKTKNTEKIINYNELRPPRKVCKCDGECDPGCKESKLNEYRTLELKSNQIFKGKFKKDNDPNENYNIIFIDTETFEKKFDKDTRYHIPYCLNASVYTKDIKFVKNNTYYGLTCINEFLSSLTKHCILIAHNAMFEFKMLIDHLTSINSLIDTGSRLKEVHGMFYNHHIIIKDSLAFINDKLENFPALMKLDITPKGKYPYKAINENNIEGTLTTRQARLNIEGTKEDKDQFIKECELAGAIKDGIIDVKKITIAYCRNDVEILEKGYLEFRRLTKTQFDMDILYYMSIPQLTNQYLIREGCFKGCYQLSGISEDFIRRSLVGGRVMTKQNKSCIVNKEIADLDANSLYPSAMVQMNGFVKGLPKVINDVENFEKNKHTYDEYFVEIEALGITTPRDFPLLSITKDGIRNFTNDVVGHHFFVDRVSLEDAVEFQGLTYKVLRGYYFNEGYNTKIKDTMKNLYAIRQQYKKEKNNLQLVIKLLMNASYGKTIQKPILKEKKIINGSEEIHNDFIFKHHNTIDHFIKINETTKCYIMNKSILDHYSSCHIGINILSMSKRIMNKVMCLAEDIGDVIEYQDTDSLHINFDTKIEQAYEDKYNTKLVGNDLGQFSSDFSINGQYDKTYEPRSIKFIGIGKKTYLDVIQYKDTNGDFKTQLHYRMKGIPSITIKKHQENTIELYESLYNGKEIEFDLSDVVKLQNDSKCTFRIMNTKKGDFKRTVSCNQLPFDESDDEY